MKLGDKLWVVGIVLAIALCIGMAVFSRSWHEQGIQEWARAHEYTVISIERVGMFDNDSPWWRTKGDDLCRVVLSDGHRTLTAFSRQRFLGSEQKLKGE